MLKYLIAKAFKKLRLSSIRNSAIHETSKIESGSNLINVTMGRYSYCGYDCEMMNVKIGSFCSIASNVVIGGAMHPFEWVSTSPVFYDGRDSLKKKFSTYARPKDKLTVIGNDVWIGDGVKIKQGVRVGNGVVIGMGSIVTKDVPDYAVVVGNPARVIKMRFEEHIVKKLLVAEWWNWPDEKIGARAHLIQEPEKFIE